MTIRKKLSAAMPFAQLFGISPRAEEEDDEKEKSKRARRAEEDDKEKDDEEDDKKGRKAKRAEDDDDMEDEEDDKKSRRAKGENEDDEDDDKKGRKAKRAEEDDDKEDDEDDEDKKDAKSKKAIVAQERARCARILAHGLKTSNPEQACVFAFDTNMSADAAISALSVARSVGARGSSLGERMKDANVTHAGAGGGEESSGVSPIAQKIIAAAARASR
ncbi:hypothetical protein [Pseudomonas sp. MWU12-2345]|uniref:hypothetical protein n=1 Tax=Pseudomonas sp. MWU12-2345 TaxID=2928689 RepID=UPI00200C1266|nr:hypothetical protein [Pseudomonas sp. MWU12-2345]